MSSGSEQAFEEARTAWRAALRDHVRAPPDASFSAGLATLAASARQRADACRAAYWGGFESPPARGGVKPPYELQPGTGVAVRKISVGRAYAELADVASHLAEAIDAGDRASGLLPAPRRGRRVGGRLNEHASRRSKSASRPCPLRRPSMAGGATPYSQTPRSTTSTDPSLHDAWSSTQGCANDRRIHPAPDCR